MMLDELAREFTSGLARVGRRTVRSFFYTPDDWLIDHGDAGMQDYLDWLVLMGIMQDRVKDEGLFLQEVPFVRTPYLEWLGETGLADDAVNRSEYLRTMDEKRIKEHRQGLILKPAAPKEQSCTSMALLLPVSIEWDQSPAVAKRMVGAMDEGALRAIAEVLVEAYDLDSCLDLISEYRCTGCRLEVYPRFVDAGDFDGLFGFKYQGWVRTSVTGVNPGNGFANRLPKAKAPAPKGDGFAGLCIGVYGCLEETTKLTSLEMSDEDCDRIAAIVCNALKLPPDSVWFSDALAERGAGEDECMKLMGVYGDDDADPIIDTKGMDLRLASLIIDPIDLGMERAEPKGVVLPFVSRTKPL